MTNDPWKHRSAKMCCATCMSYVEKKTSKSEIQIRYEDSTEEDSAEKPQTIGRCRRHAPVMSGYPVVFETDWCGDHKLDENVA